jgi:uncharacterized RDD family membrane protein YckC
MTVPYGYAPPPALQRDPTAVVGRRFGAFFIDLIPTVLAVIVFFVIFFGAATRIPDAGYNFCDRVNDKIFSFDVDPQVDQYDDGYVCIQSEYDAIVVANSDVGRAAAIASLVSLLSVANLFIVQGITGASVGKHLVQLRVVRDDGQLAGFGRNAGRTAMLIVDELCCIVGLVTVLATKPHRRVGDMVAGTYVVHKDSVGTSVHAPLPVSTASTPAWQPPAAASPAQTWGTTPGPASQSTPAPTDAPVGTPTPAVPQQQPPTLPPGAEMRWDERWNAWLYWDPAAQRWLRHDTASGQWIPM